MQDGDMEAFSRLYEVMCPDVMRTITRTGVKDADVEDIMQEVFIDVVNSCRSCREPQAAVKWINRIAFNKSVDFIRKNYREVLVTEGDEETFEESDLVAPIAMPENIAESKEIQRLVNNILCQLPPVQLAIVRAYYFNEMKVHDIAEQMKMPEGTVKTYLYKSRKYIETEVKALEKNHGTRLYSVSALPILYWLFALDADACVVPKETSASVFASTTKAMGQAGEQMAVKGTATTTSSFLKTALAGEARQQLMEREDQYQVEPKRR
jgi:RNA polymerase sigma-70 factor (ECF subfamily)